MSDSLKDQLMGLGFKPPPKPEPRPAPKPARSERGHRANSNPNAKASTRANPGPKRPEPRSQAEIDLGKAYALRAATEKREREAAERAKQEAARERREARAKLDALLVGNTLNRPDAEHARHFPYGGKIKRIHVTTEQLAALNAGELGVVQSNGRYLLVAAALLAQAKVVFPEAVALEVDPNAPVPAEDYGDPQFQVPDDLVW